MPRPPRLLLSQSYYHVMARGNNRRTVFESNADYHYYLNLVRRFKADHPFDLFHYCLMPNHVHLLIKTNRATDFSTFMKRLSLAYFQHYRQAYGWVGHFWQGRFKSQPVGKDAYFIQCGKYIELNPVRAGLATDPADYQYSSYNVYAQGITNDLISEDLFYRDLGPTPGERQQRYQKIVIDGMVAASYIKPAWGSEYQRHQEAKKIAYHLR